ncbi:hypothetical protein [Allostreptomyces psammosilenae]|uniref:Uncharacterized protein n=1 Tax=Allostreptomyces psammosilenae TaxID=1892865 RepID=A0A852ZNU3_9ACTN|nr:hypothetical protein [Allostreptomyces psammosilenae]NYI03137.1 hypothetical protein [Allostreptomyces psammosilenae]
MDAFTTGILERIRETEQGLHRAQETGDDFLAEVERGELEDLIRLANDHGISVLPQVA